MGCQIKDIVLRKVSVILRTNWSVIVSWFSETELRFCFTISHVLAVNLLWQVILKVQKVMQWSQFCTIFFSLKSLGHLSLFVKLLRCGLAIAVFSTKQLYPEFKTRGTCFKARAKLYNTKDWLYIGVIKKKQKKTKPKKDNNNNNKKKQ